MRLKDGLMGKALPEYGRGFCRVHAGERRKRGLQEGRQGMQTFVQVVLVKYPFQYLLIWNKSPYFAGTYGTNTASSQEVPFPDSACTEYLFARGGM